jgi:hypothetical protein
MPAMGLNSSKHTKKRREKPFGEESLEADWVAWAEVSFEKEPEAEYWRRVLTLRYGFEGGRGTPWSKMRTMHGFDVEWGGAEQMAKEASEIIRKASPNAWREVNRVNPYHLVRGWCAEASKKNGFALLEEVMRIRENAYKGTKWDERGFLNFLKDAGLKIVVYRKKRYVQSTWIPEEALRQEVEHQKKKVRQAKKEWDLEHIKVVQVKLPEKLRLEIEEAARIHNWSVSKFCEEGIHAFLTERPWANHIWFFQGSEVCNQKMKVWTWVMPKKLHDKSQQEANVKKIPLAHWLKRGLYWMSSSDPALEKHGLSIRKKEASVLDASNPIQASPQETEQTVMLQGQNPPSIKSWFKKTREQRGAPTEAPKFIVE